MRIPLLVVILAALAMPLGAATRTWTGSADGDWNDALNWDALPAAGDDLVFPAGATTLVTNNDFPMGIAFHSIQIAGAGYSIAGNQIAVGAGGIVSGFSATISAPLRLIASVPWTSTGGTLTTGVLELNGFTLTLDAQTGDGKISGSVTGSGGIVKIGPGDWTVTGPSSTYTGMVVINEGRLIAAGVDALGFGGNTPANGTVVNSGGTLVFAGIPIASEHLTISGIGHLGNGVLQSNGGSSQYGTTVLADGTVAMNILGSLAFVGVVTGPGRFGMGGDGLIFLGNSANDFAGPIVWGATGTAQSNLALLAHNAIPAAHSITVGGAAGAIFNVNGFTQSIESLNGSGPTSLGVGGTLTLTDPSGTYPGAITGSGTLIVAGGFWTMTGASTWNGTLLHNAGDLALDGGSIAANVQSNAQFHFNGSVAGSVTVNTSIIHLGPTPTSGNFTQTGGVYNQIIAGGAPGQYSLLTVTGTVTLGGALDLDVVAGAPYPPGTTFTMIDNDGSDPVIGTFTGYPEGALVATSSQRFTISYVGGTGNDVVLTGIPPRPATTTALTAAPNPSRFGENVTLRAVVTSDAGTPTGTVSFYDGLTFLGDAPLVDGTATLIISTLTVGSHNLFALFEQNDLFELSGSNTFVQVVVSANVPALDPRALVALAAMLAFIAARMLRSN